MKLRVKPIMVSLKENSPLFLNFFLLKTQTGSCPALKSFCTSLSDMPCPGGSFYRF